MDKLDKFAAILPILILLASSAGVARGDPYGDLCVVVNPLRTRYISAWSEVSLASAARGCASVQTATHQVHVVRLLNPVAGDVSLEIVDENPMPRRIVLILDSPQAQLRWNVKSTGLDQRQQHNIIVTGESSVDLGDLRASVSSRGVESRAALQRFVERRYKAVSSFSEVSSANRLRLVLLPPRNISSGGLCSFSSTATPSPVLKAWKSKLLNMEGCFHPEYIGLYPRDVHIIEVTNSTDNSSAVEDISLHLASADSAETAGPRHLVLILKAARPVRWILSSSARLGGILTIVSDQTVHNGEISSQQKLEVRSENMPDGFAMLILSATGLFGPPVSYSKVAGATRILLTVTKPSKAVADSKVEVAASHSPPSLEMGVRSLDRGIASHQPNNKGGKRNAAALLQQALQLHCHKSHMTAVLPRSLADSLAVGAVWLNDRSCTARRNSSSWTVQTPVTSCGTTSSSNGKVTTYSNMVHIQVGSQQHPASSDDEDFEGSGSGGESEGPSVTSRHLTLPISCNYEPVFPIGGFEGADDDNVLDPVEVSRGQMDLYHMEMHRNSDFSSPVLQDSRNEIVFEEQLFVRAWIDGVPYIKTVTEKCWISNSSDSSDPGRLILVQNACPAHSSVRMLPSNSGQYGGFSFSVSKDFAADLELLYIHCKLGLCTNDINRSQGNLKLCVDPNQHCSGRHVLKPFLEDSLSTAQQILVRGPFSLVATLSDPSGSKGMTASETSDDPFPSPQIIVVGIATEIVVGIALASFVIGVALTAILWCIHMRTGTSKQIRTDESAKERRNARQDRRGHRLCFDLALRSSSSSSSSSTATTTTYRHTPAAAPVETTAAFQIPPSQ